VPGRRGACRRAGDEAYLFKSGTDWLLSLPRPGNVGYEIVKVIKAKNIIS
jgi:hypothetical protein